MLCYYPHKNSKVVLDPFKSDFGISFILVLIKKKKNGNKNFWGPQKPKYVILCYFIFIVMASSYLKALTS